MRKIIHVLLIIIGLFVFFEKTTVAHKKEIVSEIKKYLEFSVGYNQFVIEIDSHDKNYYWIEIYPIYEISFFGDTALFKFPVDYTADIESKLNSKYHEYKFTVKQMSAMPQGLLNELKRKNNLKNIMIISLVGIVGMFISFIIFQVVRLSRKESLLEKSFKERNIEITEWVQYNIDKHALDQVILRLSNDSFKKLLVQENVSTLYEERTMFVFYTYYIRIGPLTLTSVFSKKLEYEKVIKVKRVLGKDIRYIDTNV